MNPPASTGPVVVGIDGSRAAIDAAFWAADEASTRGVALRLVHVVDVDDEGYRDLDEDPAEVARDWPETESARASMFAAATAVRDTGKPVTLETEILWGEIDSTLI